MAKRKTLKQYLYNWLLYLTNNESTSKDEIRFDIIFWIGMTLAVLISVPLLIYSSIVNNNISDLAWSAIVIIFYLESWDVLRHNRTGY